MTEAGQERLAVELRDRELARQRESDPDGIQSADTPRTIAGDVLASDWLAERDARIRRQALAEAVEAILRASPPLNSELLYNGDPRAAAYVEGFKDAHDAVANLRDGGGQ